MKKCNKCETIKEIVDFSNNKNSKDGKSHMCKSCFQEWYKNNKEKVDLQHKEYYYQDIEKSRERGRKKYQKFKDSYQIKTKLYFINNKEKMSTARRKRENWRFKNDIGFNLIKNLRSRVVRALKYGKKYKSTMEYVGCDLPFLKNYLESKFLSGMTWENHGLRGWHIDHIIPCAAFDLADPKQQKQCFHYTNLQPLWAKDNLKKHDKILILCERE